MGGSMERDITLYVLEMLVLVMVRPVKKTVISPCSPRPNHGAAQGVRSYQAQSREGMRRNEGRLPVGRTSLSGL